MSIERLAICAALLLAASVGKRVFKSYVNPITIMTMPWFVVLAGQQLLVPGFPFGTNAAFVIGTAAMMFCSASLVTALVHHRAAPAFSIPDISITPQPQKTRFWGLLCWFLVAIAITHLCVDLYFAYYLGIGLRDEGSVDPYSFYNEITGRASVATGILFRGLVTITYIGAFLFAIELARSRRLALRSAVFFAAVIATSLFTTVKTLGLLTLSITAIAISVIFSRLPVRISTRLVFTLVLATVFIIGYAWVASTRRYGGQQEGTVLANNLAVQCFGASSALSEYLDRSAGWEYGNFRGLSIMGPLEWFGIVVREQGVYERSIYLTADAIPTNQYTGLRLLLDDMGFGGMMITMGFLGAITTSLFFAFYSRPSVAKCALLCNLYLLVLWLPITFWSYYSFWTVQLLVCPLLGGYLIQLKRVAPVGQGNAKRAKRSPAAVRAGGRFYMAVNKG